VAVDAASVFWLTDKELLKLDKSSGTTTTLASGFLDPPCLVLDDANVYVASPFISKGGTGGLVRVPKAGGASTALVKKDALAVAVLAAHCLAVDAGSVYWTDTNGKVMGVAKNGGAPRTIDSVPLNPNAMRSIALDSSGIYWANYGDAMKTPRDGYLKGVPASGGKPVFFLDTIKAVGWHPTGGGSPSDVALDADNVYWTDFGPSTSSNQEIDKTPKAGGTVTTLAAMSTEPTGIAVDSSFIYWTTFGDHGVAGTVMKVSKTGGEAKTLATAQDRASSVAVDDTNVYWTTNGGTVMKISK
jgi:hypothetical protein